MASIFIRLYPLKTVDEVMETPFAKLVQQALNEVIEENFPTKLKGTFIYAPYQESISGSNPHTFFFLFARFFSTLREHIFALGGH